MRTNDVLRQGSIIASTATATLKSASLQSYVALSLTLDGRDKITKVRFTFWHGKRGVSSSFLVTPPTATLGRSQPFALLTNKCFLSSGHSLPCPPPRLLLFHPSPCPLCPPDLPPLRPANVPKGMTTLQGREFYEIIALVYPYEKSPLSTPTPFLTPINTTEQSKSLRSPAALQTGQVDQRVPEAQEAHETPRHLRQRDLAFLVPPARRPSPLQEGLHGGQDPRPRRVLGSRQRGLPLQGHTIPPPHGAGEEKVAGEAGVRHRCEGLFLRGRLSPGAERRGP